MKKFVRNGLLALGFAAPAFAATPVVPASASAKGGAANPRVEIEALIKDGATVEKSDGCEAAWLKYKAAADKLATVKGTQTGRLAQLEGIVTNKLDKLQACYTACQPSDRQKELFGTAKDVAEAEPHRAAKILKTLLVGRSTDRCVFWSDARALLRTLPGQAEAMDADAADPCAVTPELQKSINDVHEAVRKERAAASELAASKAKPARVDELADLYRSMDATRSLLFDLRESFVECDQMNKQLAADGQGLKESMLVAQDLVSATYREQLAALGRHMHAAQAQLAQKDELLNSQIGEQEKLKKQLEQLSSLNEDLYNDLFAMSQAEAVNFSVEVEGRRVEQPMEEIRALLGSEKKVMETLAAKYPEYFRDGVNLEGLKRKKLVLEKLQQMMKRYGARGDQRLGYARAMAELGATVDMMDKAIGATPATQVAEAAPVKEASTGGGGMGWLLGGGGVLAVAGLTFLRMRRDSNG